jgi:hypothetical protein
MTLFEPMAPPPSTAKVTPDFSIALTRRTGKAFAKLPKNGSRDYALMLRQMFAVAYEVTTIISSGLHSGNYICMKCF